MLLLSRKTHCFLLLNTGGGDSPISKFKLRKPNCIYQMKVYHIYRLIFHRKPHENQKYFSRKIRVKQEENYRFHQFTCQTEVPSPCLGFLSVRLSHKITELCISCAIWHLPCLLHYEVNKSTPISDPKDKLTVSENSKLHKYFSLKLIMIIQSKSVGVSFIKVHLMWSSAQF